jgi:hypothetical protein
VGVGHHQLWKRGQAWPECSLILHSLCSACTPTVSLAEDPNPQARCVFLTEFLKSLGRPYLWAGPGTSGGPMLWSVKSFLIIL